jgi:hypothetical protein
MWIALAATSVAIWLTPAVRADNIDEALIRQAPKIMNHLRQKGYENVGVLTFRLQKPNEQTTFDGGLINRNMVDRLENALVLAMSPEHKPVGIIDRADEEAAEKIKDANYRRPDSRTWLFKPKYPLKWGEKTQLVEADAFLTGKVTLSPDLKTTTVAVELFDKQNPGKISRLLEIPVKTDRYILADAGQGFSLSRALSKGHRQFRRGSADLDDDIIIFDEFEDLDLDGSGALELAQGDTAGTDLVEQGVELPGDKPASGTTPSARPGAGNAKSSGQPKTAVGGDTSVAGFPVELKVYYDGKEQQLRVDAANGVDNWIMGDPKEGQRVTFGLRNLTDERLGVVLTINGLSTLYDDVGQPDQLTKWVLEPGTQYSIKGTYQEDQETFAFIEGLSEELSKEKFNDFGPDAGFIHLYVFRPSISEASTPAFSRSMRQLPARMTAKQDPGTPWELQALIARNANARSSRGLMASASGEGKEQLRELPLGNVSLTDAMVIQYYPKPQ